MFGIKDVFIRYLLCCFVVLTLFLFFNSFRVLVEIVFSSVLFIFKLFLISFSIL